MRYLHNKSVRSIGSLAPKLIMVILKISPPFLPALRAGREKGSGSIYNIHSSTLIRGEFHFGKPTPSVGVSMLHALLLWALTAWLYGAPIKGNPHFFFLATTLGVVCTAGIGLVVSVLGRTHMAATIGTAIFTLVPAVLYTGVLVPVSSHTEFVQVVAHLLAAMIYKDIVLACLLKYPGWRALWPDVLVLALSATVVLTAVYFMLHKRQKV